MPSSSSRTGSQVGAGVTRWNYGGHPAQYADLYSPTGPIQPAVLVIIHGGFWRSQYDSSLGDPLSRDLADRGFACWNLEYRRVGDGGGWPATFDDIAAGIDLLGRPPGVNLRNVIAIGHSAGGQLAVWAAGRHTLPSTTPGANPTVRLTAAIPQAGVLDLTRAGGEGVGGLAVTDLIGGTPAGVSDRYAIADPIRRLPIGVPVRAVHSRADDMVPFDQSEHYVRAATAVGDDAELVEVDGDHYAVIDTDSDAWHTIVALLPGLLI